GRDDDPGELADQVIVRGRRIRRQMVHHEVAVPVDRREPTIQKALACRTVEERRALTADDPIGKVPVDQANTELEGAAPVRTLEERTRVDPAVDEPPHAVEVARVAAKPIGLREPDDLEMPVELPE